MRLLNDKHILVVDDDQDILMAAKLLLKRHFKQVSICNQPEHLGTLLSKDKFDAILLDMNFAPGESSGKQGFKWLKFITDKDPNAVVVMITAHGGVNIAVKAMKFGATDFIEKPWQNEKVIATLTSAVKLNESRQETERLKQSNQLLVESQGFQHIIGKSEAISQVMSVISKAAPTDANVLILGENGTGKELAAREIHNQSLRQSNIFMSVDLGAISESLFESELFGHEKGAFTGANKARIGKLVAANGGTLFLDEIGNIPLHLQAKLLTILEQRKVTPIGSNKSIDIDVRLISATNVNKAELSNETTFRQDLLFRLNTVEISLPPLRDRQHDIIDIAQYYIVLYSQKYRKANKSLSEEAIKAALSYPWPGNVRALRHAIERAIILSDRDQLSAKDLQIECIQADINPTNSISVAKQPSISSASSAALNEDLHLERSEKRIIAAALKKHRYNISKSANELGLTRASLYRRMEKHGL